jgi:micrococcal nuclease
MKSPSTKENRTGRLAAGAREFPGPVMLVALLAVALTGWAGFVAPARAQEMPAGMQVGDGGASVNRGDVYAGNGCAKAGPVVAGDCEKGGEGGKDKRKGGDSGGPAAAGASDAQYDEEGSAPETTGSESTQLITEMESTTELEGTTPLADGEEPAPEGPGDGTDPTTDEGCATEGPAGETITATVERVVDGDTLETSEGTVRLIGVDTPGTVDPDQPPEPGGQEASDFTKDALEGERVELEVAEDPEDDYDRTLAYVWADDGTLYNETLLRRGLGELLIIPPNDRYEECLSAAEASARDEGLGIWASSEGTTLSAGTTVPEAAPSETSSSGSSTPPPAEEDGRKGFLQTLFGDDDDGAPEPATWGTTGLDTTGLGTTTFDTTTFAPDDAERTDRKSSVAVDQYAVNQPPDKEVQDPEIQEKEIQDPELQEAEVQEPEVQQGLLPESTAPETAFEAPASPQSAAPVAAAPISTLPETSGISLLRPAALLPGLLLASGGLTWLVLHRANKGTAAPASGDDADDGRD